MPVSQIEKADRTARSRAALMALAAISLLFLAYFDAVRAPEADIERARIVGWTLLVLLWLIMLATGGGLLLNRRLRSLINDEVSTDNRQRAIATGFWTAMAMAVALFFAGFYRPIALRDGVSMLAEVALAAALLRYAWLERG